MSHPLYLTTYLHKKNPNGIGENILAKFCVETYAFRPEASSPQSRTTEDTDRKAMGDFCLKARVSNVCFRTHTIHLSVSETRGVFSFGSTPDPVNQMLASGLVTWSDTNRRATATLGHSSKRQFSPYQLRKIGLCISDHGWIKAKNQTKLFALNASFHWTKTIGPEYCKFDFKLSSLVTS